MYLYVLMFALYGWVEEMGNKLDAWCDLIFVMYEYICKGKSLEGYALKCWQRLSLRDSKWDYRKFPHLYIYYIYNLLLLVVGEGCEWGSGGLLYVPMDVEMELGFKGCHKLQMRQGNKIWRRKSDFIHLLPQPVTAMSLPHKTQGFTDQNSILL